MQRKFIVKLGITLVLLIFIGYKIDLTQTKEIIFSIRLLPFFCSYLVFLLCFIPLALRLRILLKPTVLHFGLKKLIEIQFISTFYSILLPSGIGISIARWFAITKNKVGRRVFVVVTLIERMMLTLTLSLCTGVPLLFITEDKVQALRSSALPVIFFLILVCVLFFSIFLHSSAYRAFSWMMQKAQSRFKAQGVRRILGVYEDFGLYLNTRDYLFRAFIFHLFYQALIFARFYLVFASLRIGLHPITILWISMLVLLILSLPITLGGLGAREAGFAWLFTFYGIDPEKGVVLGALLSLQLFVNRGIGGILSLKESRWKGGRPQNE